MNNQFYWGTATASYQIEGAAYEGRKGLSIWDTFVKEHGKIFEGQTGETACDHYHKMKEDVAMMAELKVQAYRFSISWARIIPEGTGAVNQQGIQFYHELLDELRVHNITPFLTLYHWDYPDELHKKGGWMNPESPDWFADYAEVIAKEYGKRIRHYITFNEPQIFVGLGYQAGIHAPGYKLETEELLAISRNVMLAHGKAVMKIRQLVGGSSIGYAPTSGMSYYPVTETAENIQAAKLANDEVTRENFIMSASFWNDPIAAGKESADSVSLFGKFLSDADLRIIHQPLDFMGVNIYFGRPVSTDSRGGFQTERLKAGQSRTAMGWPVTPECLKWIPYILYKKYGHPILISENGMSCHDTVSLDGKVHDPNRIDYMQRHLEKIKESEQMGTRFLGYFYWSLMDNFEWANGYNDRFGLIYIDFETQERIPKDSYYFYQEYINNNR